MRNQMEFPRKIIANLLTIILVCFAARVLFQVIQYFFPVEWLPSFGQWQSGALPYPVLVIFQIAILAWGSNIVLKVRSEQLTPNLKTSKILLSIGGGYFLFMVFRLFAGQTFANGHYWLDAVLPTIFHILLSCFLLLLSLYHRQSIISFIQWMSYPMIILFGLFLHCTMMHLEINLVVSTYTPVLIAAICISVLEFYYPYRSIWNATQDDWINDSLFMVVIQGVVPKFLGFIVVILMADQMVFEKVEIFWPHHWPVFFQFLLMLLSADLLRYWLHRLAHNWTPLWRLHAIHHSPHKLYWTNVGRFHPLEKCIQYVFDALPFILLGVSPQVMAMYFVFYATNGFFQHCNINLRLGFLNYLVSGPELHRWHHSKRIDESNNNYGNNLIIWDLIFNSRFLPSHGKVEQLGLVNRNYPLDFKNQMTSPFKGKLDKMEK